MTIPDFLDSSENALPNRRFFAEGREMDVVGDSLHTQDLFSLAMTASLEPGGKPVVCQDFLPELSMRIEARPLPSGSGAAGPPWFTNLNRRYGALRRAA